MFCAAVALGWKSIVGNWWVLLKKTLPGNKARSADGWDAPDL